MWLNQGQENLFDLTRSDDESGNSTQLKNCRSRVTVP